MRRKTLGLEPLAEDWKIYWLVEYNEERPHSGKYCFGKTPRQTFLDSIPLAKEKMLGESLQTEANLAAGLSG